MVALSMLGAILSLRASLCGPPPPPLIYIRISSCAYIFVSDPDNQRLRLFDPGFNSFDHAWTEDDAVAIAERCPPDLVLVRDNPGSDNAVGSARRICEKRDITMLRATAVSVLAKQ